MRNTVKKAMAIFTPSHQEGNYLENLNRAYIDLKYAPTSQADIEVKFKLYRDEDNYHAPYGCSSSGYRNVNRIVFVTQTKPRYMLIQWMNSSAKEVRYDFDSNPLYTPITFIKKGYENFINGIELKSNANPPTYETSPQDMALFCDYNEKIGKNAFGKMAIYYFKLWDNLNDGKGKTLIFDLVPVVKDGVACMYNKVDDSYLYGIDGEFTIG